MSLNSSNLGENRMKYFSVYKKVKAIKFEGVCGKKEWKKKGQETRDNNSKTFETNSDFKVK